MPVYLVTIEGTLQSSCYSVAGGVISGGSAAAGEVEAVSVAFRPSAVCGQALPDLELFAITWAPLPSPNHTAAPRLACTGDFSLVDGSECRAALRETRAGEFRRVVGRTAAVRRMKPFEQGRFLLVWFLVR